MNSIANLISRGLVLSLGLTVGLFGGVGSALQQALPVSGQEDAKARRSNGRLICADTLRDQSTNGCILASSVPQLGDLYPISTDLFVDSDTGFVGLGTSSPSHRLTVAGDSRMFGDADVSGTLLAASKVRLRRPDAEFFGVIETFGFVNFVTNLISTVSIDDSAGALATYRLNSPLVALTTPAVDSNSGFVAVHNNGAEIAGINGATGNVFGVAKLFVQPHPVDSTKEIQYVSLEGPEHGVYFRGSANLRNGAATLGVPESFALVARPDGLTVTVTPQGPSRGLYVEHKGLEKIVVRENYGGAGDVAFDYVVMGVRSALPQHVAIRANTHFALEPGTEIAEGKLPGSYRELLIQNGTLNDDGSVNEAAAAGLGWHIEQGEWRGGRSASARIADGR